MPAATLPTHNSPAPTLVDFLDAARARCSPRLAGDLTDVFDPAGVYAVSSVVVGMPYARRRPMVVRRVRIPRRRTRRRPAMLKNKEKMSLGRNFPPTVMRWTAENVFNRLWGSRSNNAASYNVIRIDPMCNGTGIREYLSGDASGTGTASTAKNPRNWATVTSLYNRGRILGTTVKVEFQVGAQTVLAIPWVVYYWISSLLDTGNPLSIADNIGTSAPWQASEITSTSARTILDSNRRVNRRVIRAQGSSRGAASGKIVVKLTPFNDRLGNTVVGGKHVRTITNAPGGTIQATDVSVASLLTDFSGVGNRLNIVIMPLTVGTTSGHNITGTRITLFNHIELYDRVHDD